MILEPQGRNNFEIFWEEFEGILDTRPESGIDSPDDESRGMASARCG